MGMHVPCFALLPFPSFFDLVAIIRDMRDVPDLNPSIGDMQMVMWAPENRYTLSDPTRLYYTHTHTITTT